MITHLQINPREVYTQDFYEIPSANYGRRSRATNSMMAGQREPSLPSVNLGDDEVNSPSMLEGATDFMDDEFGYEEEYNGTDTELCSSDFDEPIIGKHGATYMRHGAFNLTTQQYPNAVNMVRKYYIYYTRKATALYNILNYSLNFPVYF